MPQRKSQLQIWYEEIKLQLLISEPKNILARAEACQIIVNKCIADTNARLSLPSVPQYSCTLTPTDHLSYLLNWPGLRIDNSPNTPKDRKAYEKKSKNWLNGRRAPNYGKTLFPFFIHDCERFIMSTAIRLFEEDKNKQTIYSKIVLYKVLAQLMGCSVGLHEQAKKAPFFCKNSVQRKGRLRELLQSFATDHQYVQGFPSCSEEAINYFNKKASDFLSEFQQQQNAQQVTSKSTTIIKKEHADDKSNVMQQQSVSTKMAKTSVNKQSNNEMFWRNKYMEIKEKLEQEKRERIGIEKERDLLRNYKFNLENPYVYLSALSQQLNAQLQVPMINQLAQLTQLAAMTTNNNNALSTNSASPAGLPVINDNGSLNSLNSLNSNVTIPTTIPPLPTINSILNLNMTYPQNNGNYQ